ncbi:hypothetical protein [Nocardioides sp. B-3]|uniref:hypothetical protein n=1 Tax=Nocardioides sp. B-3 TaxID=2895565 RepID=UPI002152468D|nr:hypothetical protein [Nocardioides sp. B-3]UUZ61535.1 hypothetical protein LP418_13845 [Nocardioides sp. B-3]
MTTTALAPNGTTSRTRMAGLACLLGGLLGAAGGLYPALRTPVVAEDMWTYPLRAGGEFATMQTMFALTHVGMLPGLLALGWCGAVPPSRWGRIGRGVAMAGMAVLTVNEFVAISVAGEPSDSSSAGNVGAVYGVATLMIAIGMIVAGVAAIRGGARSGWQQWLPLVVGRLADRSHDASPVRRG